MILFDVELEDMGLFPHSVELADMAVPADRRILAGRVVHIELEARNKMLAVIRCV